MTKRYKVVTLGCRTNQYESQAYRDQLELMGYAQAAGDETADLCIVNTCTVTESADSSSRHAINKLVRQNPEARVVVTGCMVESKGADLEGVNLVVANGEKESLIEQLFPEEEIPEFQIRNFEAHTRAFVKVQDGCNSFCSYCIIPYVRGRSRSREIPGILQEIEGLVEQGFREVVLTGINIGDFDGSGSNLAGLIRQVDQIEGLDRIRVSSIDPDEVDEELLSTIIEGKKTCNSMHIVLQAGSNAVLSRMRRKYTRQLFLETIDRVKAADPDFSFTTDIIVGFPGESEADFSETLQIMEEVEFSKVHMFPYSKREKTRAARWGDDVPAAVKKERKKRLMALAEAGAKRLRQRYVGRQMRVLTEDRGGGHTENFLKVQIEGGVRPNELVDVTLVSNGDDALIGEVV